MSFSERQTGTVVRFDEIKGYGFIRSADFPKDFFVHASSIDRGPENYRLTLEPGWEVEFDVVPARKPGQFQATNVRVIDYHEVNQ